VALILLFILPLEDDYMLLEQLNCVYYPSLNPLLYPFGNLIHSEKKFNRILIIDDDKEMNDLLRHYLKDERMVKISFAEDPFEAMDILNQQVFDTIILDWFLPEMSGPETLLHTEQIFKTDPNLPYEWEDKKSKVVLMTGMERSECKTTSTKHFRYSGFINKRNSSAQQIAESIMKHATKASTFN